MDGKHRAVNWDWFGSCTNSTLFSNDTKQVELFHTRIFQISKTQALSNCQSLSKSMSIFCFSTFKHKINGTYGTSLSIVNTKQHVVTYKEILKDSWNMNVFVTCDSFCLSKSSAKHVWKRDSAPRPHPLSLGMDITFQWFTFSLPSLVAWFRSQSFWITKFDVTKNMLVLGTWWGLQSPVYSKKNGVHSNFPSKICLLSPWQHLLIPDSFVDNRK